MEQKQIDCFIAAMKVFSANGYVDASVDEIALLSKTAKQTIYTYFESKNGLYAALSDAVIERLKHTQLPDSKLGLPEYLLSFISSFLETIEQECLGEYFRLILGEAKAFPQASGFLFLYLFCFGLPELSNKFKDTFAVNTEEGALLALILRNIIGGFALFNQIYVLAENPYLNQSMLSQILARLLQISEENREFFGIAAQ
jgi:AcrR family transcriptional regulator